MEHQDRGCCTNIGSKIPTQRMRQSPPCLTLMKKQVGVLPLGCAVVQAKCPALPCPALPCPALPCPALPCPALPCPALPCLMLGNNNCGGDWHYSFCSCCELPCLLALPLGNPVKPYSDPHIAKFLWPKHAWSFVLVLFLAQYTW